MATYFFDSSALFKRYVEESGSSWVRSVIHRNAEHQIFLVRITAVEVTSAIARRRRDRHVSDAQASSILLRFRKHLDSRYVVMEMTEGLLADATMLANQHILRAYDAVQLAAAFELNRISRGGIVLVCSDQALNRAATTEGLSTEDPNSHDLLSQSPGS